MMRRLFKAATCHALAWARLESWLDRAHPIVLGYHRVVEHVAPHAMPGLAIRVATLERQLDWIGRRTRFVGLDELAELIARGGARQRVCAVTFDDGYADVHRHAWPLLRRMGIPAAAFVVSGAVGAGTPLAHDRLYGALVRLNGQPIPPRLLDVLRSVPSDPYARTRALLGALEHDELLRAIELLEARTGPPPADDERPLDWTELRELHRAGVVIGSHTRTHPWLVREPPERLAAELRGSKRELEQGLGAPVSHFAYPDGQFHPHVVQAVEEAGYRFGYTVCRHRDPKRPLLTIPRTMLWEGSSRGAVADVSGAVLDCQTLGGLLDHCARPHQTS